MGAPMFFGYALLCFAVVFGLSLAVAVKPWTFLAFAAIAAVLCLLASAGSEHHDSAYAAIVCVAGLAYVIFNAAASWVAHVRRAPRRP